mmetsp:Transcript_60762/g.131773  ORF Transcript_60762/g.131773 Transcript_60762/m.131773 type:complete len:203 (+) Transcript_60762:703-1311(+)
MAASLSFCRRRCRSPTFFDDLLASLLKVLDAISEELEPKSCVVVGRTPRLITRRCDRDVWHWRGIGTEGSAQRGASDEASASFRPWSSKGDRGSRLRGNGSAGIGAAEVDAVSRRSNRPSQAGNFDAQDSTGSWSGDSGNGLDCSVISAVASSFVWFVLAPSRATSSASETSFCSDDSAGANMASCERSLPSMAASRSDACA